MATGESIFFGAARVWQPLMWLFFVTAIAVYIWPGHISTGADALESLTGIPWQLSASVGLVVIGLMFTVVKFVYNIVEAVLAFLVGVLVMARRSSPRSSATCPTSARRSRVSSASTSA